MPHQEENKIPLSDNPTDTEKIYYLEKNFELLNKSKFFTNSVKKLDCKKTPNSFENIKYILTNTIDFEKLNESTKITFYLLDSNGKVVLSNIDNTFSTYQDYIDNNAYFYNLSEEQGFLNELYELEVDGRIGTNLLETPILNVVVNVLDQPLGILYYLIGTRHKCNTFTLVSFIYTNGGIPI